jgi:enoyl-CoA hydratase
VTQSGENLYGLPDELNVEADGALRIVTLNRPDSLNAVNATLHRALADVWQHLADDSEVGAVVLTGAGRAFSAGGDLRWFAQIAEDAQLRERVLSEGRQIVDGMINLKPPVVVAINGAAVGLGCSVAMMADIVVMSSRAYLADPHVAVGLVAGDGAIASWPLLTSLIRAKEYILLGDRIPAIEAERIGLANRVMEPDDVLPTAMHLAHRLAALPRQAVRETKRALNIIVRDSANRVLDFALSAENESFTTEDHRNAVAKLLGN